MTDDLWVQRRIIDLKIGFIFLTRLPLSHQTPIAKGELSQALWTAPVVGVAVGLLGAGAYGLAHVLHLPPLPAAALAVAAGYARHSREQDIDVIGGIAFIENLGAPLDAVHRQRSGELI